MAVPLDWRAPKPEGLDEPRLIEETGPALRIGKIAEPVLGDFGLRLVRVKVSAANGATVQVMAERPDGTMTIEDCERASEMLSPTFDVEDIMHGAWRLEVSSPGIDRPLVRKSDFERALGCEAKIDMATSVEGRKRYRGKIAELVETPDGLAARLVVTGDDGAETSVDLPIAAMSEARLVLTDDLIRAALRREKQALKAARRGESGARRREAAKKPAKPNSKAAGPGRASKPNGPHEGDL